MRKNSKHPVIKEEEGVIETLNKLKKEANIDKEMYKSLRSKTSTGYFTLCFYTNG